MTTGLLRVRGVLIEESAAVLDIDTPTHGVAIVNARFDRRKSPVPLHWRAGDWTKPPMDIEIDPQTGAVQAAQFVLQDERIPQSDMTEAPTPSGGTPIVETEGWTSDPYLGVHCDLRVWRGSSDELIVTFGDRSAVSHNGRDRLTFGWDDASELAEVTFGPLSRQDWARINAYSV
jgi:hypothetical protein